MNNENLMVNSSSSVETSDFDFDDLEFEPLDESYESPPQDAEQELVAILRELDELDELETRNTTDLGRGQKRPLPSEPSMVFMPAEAPVFIKPAAMPALPSRSLKFLIPIAAMVLLTILAGIGYRRYSRAQINILTPTQNSILAAQELSFAWESNKPISSFVIEIYESDRLVMRQITDKNSYTPDLNQKKIFAADKSYRWIVTTNPDMKHRYYFHTEPRTFKISSAIAETESEPTIAPVSPNKPEELKPPPPVRAAPVLKKDSNGEEIPAI